ncbi:peptidoglycan bridge formation glycyltransferase FemA/FemB family protein [Candidatus Uhrbacteria bacterium]|nr:peptidoglycan bridge formation glycyltransferase FemA/FemB family protein [Candidatus Uhrbacteria bacterium]MBD3284168.1 peptidoglycan bridge formation glycyltransferase FemA/FemB family protein [Candidatus Uhrbacteria bacterium]
MNLIHIPHADEWDTFCSAQRHAQFTQSWAWGEFWKTLGRPVIRVALTDDQGAWLLAAQFSFFSRRWFWGYWYAPRGPVVRTDLQDASGELIEECLRQLRAQGLPAKALFWRIEPAVTSPVSSDGLMRAKSYMPSTTLLLDLNVSEDLLRKGMHEKTRYNIRVAERKGVTVRVAQTQDDLQRFLALSEETATRDRFLSQPSSYMRATYEHLHASGVAQIRLAEREGVLLAASMEMRYGDTTTYLYGASSSTHRNLMAPYALHWDAIREAKQEGFRTYDFHGINPESPEDLDYKDSWKGITRFKLGWGGERITYAGTAEYPLIPWVYHLLRRFRG